ncbi:MAG: hypothetical protein KAT34_15480 [Candidatus Aminicenantes bacterium]|nr:hypothetical protein [Candidatus Aminicenantes bacterium]
MILKYTIAWLGLVVVAIINGAIREKGYKKYMSELRAHQVSTVTGIILFGIFIYILSLIWKIQSAGQAITIGLLWLALTIAFEFVFGHFVMKHPWSKLLNDYNILKGRLWLLILIWTTIAPYVFYKL